MSKGMQQNFDYTIKKVIYIYTLSFIDNDD